MGILGIEFERNFTLDLKNVGKKIGEFGSVKINENITFDLNNVKPYLNFVPLLADKNRFVFTHPIGGVKRVKMVLIFILGIRKSRI